MILKTIIEYEELIMPNNLLTDILVNFAFLILGAIISYFVTIRFIHRPTLMITLKQVAAIVPDEIRAGPNLQMTYDRRPINNLAAFILEVSNKGKADIVVPSNISQQPDNSIPQPNIRFEGVRILAVKTLNNNPSKFNIPLAPHLEGTQMYVNVLRIKSGATAKFQILGTFTDNSSSLESEKVTLYSGAIPNVNIKTDGILSGRLKE